MRNGRERAETAVWRARRNAAVCALVFVVCAFVSRPFAGMPWSDDFSYMKTAFEFARTGRFVYNGWATAMLGWQVVWGAAFLKVFGVSFDVLRMSMLPVGAMCVYLFHQSLRRFGVAPRNAVIGALTLGLSPLFLPLATNFMTDVPGLFVVLLCVVMCQRAVASRTDAGAAGWLVTAALANAAGGTVRQIAWLGALVMVPATAWLLRRRRGVLLSAGAAWVASLVVILLCVRWFSVQPYALGEPLFFWPVRPVHAKHLTLQLLRAALCTLLLCGPVLAGFGGVAGGLRQRWVVGITGVLVGFAAVVAVFPRQAMSSSLLVPWMIPVLLGEWMALPGVPDLGLELGVSLLVVGLALVLLAYLVDRGRRGPEGDAAWRSMVAILGPFTVCYVLLLSPRGATTILQDRYVLGVLPFVLTVLLVEYGRGVARSLPWWSVGVLVVQGGYAVAANHNLFADARAREAVVEEMERMGVPRTAIQSGLGADGWTQVGDGGYIHDPRIRFPVSARVSGPGALDPKSGCRAWSEPLTPAIQPRFYVMDEPRVCPGASVTEALHYRRWLPPFDGAVRVQALPVRAEDAVTR